MLKREHQRTTVPMSMHFPRQRATSNGLRPLHSRSEAPMRRATSRRGRGDGHLSRVALSNADQRSRSRSCWVSAPVRPPTTDWLHLSAAGVLAKGHAHVATAALSQQLCPHEAVGAPLGQSHPRRRRTESFLRPQRRAHPKALESNTQRPGSFGIGIDILHLPRLEALVRRRQTHQRLSSSLTATEADAESSAMHRLAKRILCDSEMDEYEQLARQEREAAETVPRLQRYLSVRWAAKEAAYKALYPRFVLSWKDLCVHKLVRPTRRRDPSMR